MMMFRCSALVVVVGVGATYSYQQVSVLNAFNNHHHRPLFSTTTRTRNLDIRISNHYRPVASTPCTNTPPYFFLSSSRLQSSSSYDNSGDFRNDHNNNISNDKDDNKELQKGKLIILQDVVKELYQRQQSAERSKENYLERTHHDNTTLKTFQNKWLNESNQLLLNKQQQQEQNLQTLLQSAIIRDKEKEYEIAALEELRNNENDRMYQDQLQKVEQSSRKQLQQHSQDQYYRENVSKLRSTKINTLQQEVKNLSSQLQLQTQSTSQERIQSLQQKQLQESQAAAMATSQIMMSKDNSNNPKLQDEDKKKKRLSKQNKKKIEERATQVDDFHRHCQTIEALEDYITRYTNDTTRHIQSLQAEREELKTKLHQVQIQVQEQVEIATAAVIASEQREIRMQQELLTTQQLLKQSRFHVKIQKFVMNVMTEENVSLRKELDEWTPTSLEQQQQQLQANRDQTIMTSNPRQGIRRRIQKLLFPFMKQEIG